MKNLEIWTERYGAYLAQAIAAYPSEYGYGLKELPAVLARMKTAFEKGSYNKDGRAIVETCRDFKIKHTYKAINAFLAGA